MASDTHILIATRNKGKVKEIRDLVQDLPVEFRSMADFPDLPDVEEDGLTFEENALKKARTLSRETQLITLADDSGLSVDALDGRPGVLSARYGGQDLSDEQKCTRLLREMEGVRDELRSARFVCVMALVYPSGMERTFGGVCEGKIIHELRGSEGFGYDPIFLYEEAGRTFAEMDRAAKNRVSHRGKALKQVADFLRQEYQ
jgi:XTP/dITP diphosphohydrolase